MKAPSFSRWPPAMGPVRGFTLLEVALAIFIIVGMLVVILFFYRQAAQLRQDLIEETERLAAARLVLNRLSMELRCARLHKTLVAGLSGTSNTIEFVRTSLPSPASWARDDLGRTVRPENDLRVVRYELGWADDDPFEVAGLTRSEGPVPEFDLFFAEEEGLGVEEPDLSSPSATPTSELITERLQYLRFRYWDGAGWQDSWSGLDLPLGVEISLGAEPLPPPDRVTEEESAVEYPFELFRRIVCLPGGSPPAKTNAFLELLRDSTTTGELP